MGKIWSTQLKNDPSGWIVGVATCGEKSDNDREHCQDPVIVAEPNRTHSKVIRAIEFSGVAKVICTKYSKH